MVDAVGHHRHRDSPILLVQVAGGVRHVAFATAGSETLGPRVDADVVQLRQHVAAQTVRYEYSLDDGRSFQPLGEPRPMRFSWWKGARPALFNWSTDAAASRRGHVDVDRVEIEVLAPERK